MEIRPITDLRNTTTISELCHNHGEPIFITKNGYGDLVVMGIEVYNRITTTNELYQKLEAGLQEIREGKVQDGPTALAALREKHGM
jgi:prevent-host-death family protein